MCIYGCMIFYFIFPLVLYFSIIRFERVRSPSCALCLVYYGFVAAAAFFFRGNTKITAHNHDHWLCAFTCVSFVDTVNRESALSKYVQYDQYSSENIQRRIRDTLAPIHYESLQTPFLDFDST